MTWTLFKPDDTWSLWAFLAVGAAVAVHLEQRYRWAAAASGAVLGLGWGLLGVNLRIVPAEAPVWDAVWGYAVPLALPLLLLQTDLRRILRESGRLFWLFNLTAAGSVLGGFLAALLFRGAIADVHLPAGIMTGSYVGGTVNFVAIAASLDAPRSLLNSLVVADNLLMAVAFGFLVAIPGWRFFRQRYPHPFEDEAAAAHPGASKAASYWAPKEISLRDIALALAIAFAINAAADGLGGWLKQSGLPEPLRGLLGQKYLVIPLLSVGLATALPSWVGKIRGAHEVGTYLIYLFFVVIGVPASLVEIARSGPILLAFTATMALVTVLFTLGMGKLLRFSIEECVTAANAALGGPTTAAGMAISKGWEKLVLPAILAGVWGYVVGNYLGLFVEATIRRLWQ